MDYVKAREDMVRTQIENGGIRAIKDKRVLDVMRKVERHRFVRRTEQGVAYSDRPLPIDCNQTISQPYMVALMTTLLDLKGDEKVLEIGTGSGYQTAVLAELSREVYTVEIIERLGRQAKGILGSLGYKNIRFKISDGYYGWPEFSPYDGIIVTCTCLKIPDPLIDQLKDPGQMVLPLGGRYPHILTLIKKERGKIETTSITGCAFVLMAGRH
ncbi:MAG: protein-L-isoaspartate(D-aspartate) O-methyltransferase [bacterium]|nr:protein-L-isoaspartate(D-aspartate) O-methyltransferase [bacterium]